MSRDQMTDVFPVLFNFVKGEMPTAEKFTGMVKIIDVAFSDISRAVGDPWDTQTHVFGLSSDRKDLSLEKLSQASLARSIGPVDWVGPVGGDFNSESTVSSVTLSRGRNSWNLGYPLVKVSSTVTESSFSSALSELEWGTDIYVSSDLDNCLSDEKSSLEEVQVNGDFFVDYKKGTITCYYPALSGDIVLSVSNFHMLPAGPPWASHNVIPTWRQTASLCSASLVSDDSTTAVLTITLPTAERSTRASTIGTYIENEPISSGSRNYNAAWSGNGVPNVGASYRLPASIVNSDIQVGDTIPEGFISLWNETEGRIQPNITFKYASSTTVTIECASGSVSEGANYRLITSGTSLSEAVNYLSLQERYNTHVGLNDSYHLGYSIPLSHKSLEDTYSGSFYGMTYTEMAKFRFAKSNTPTNCHPQYLHRGGYLEDDDGNSENAMRGILGFTGVQNSSKQFDYEGGTSNSGNLNSTYGIYWGGPSSDATSGNTRLLFEGGEENTTWTSGVAERLGFGLQDTGANPVISYSGERYGALSLYPWYGTPLYLRGRNTGPIGSDAYLGAVLGFDLGQNSEMNYIKLMKGQRSRSYDQVNLPAQVSQTWSRINPCMPNLSNPVASDQVREFRFRGVSYVSSATNTDDSLGGTNTRSGDDISEFENYYVSPAIVGADFINVYSNAIFFSESGDGKSTAFTIDGLNWMNNSNLTSAENDYKVYGQINASQPTGLYYFPSSSATFSNAFIFSIYEAARSGYTQPLKFGDATGFQYASNLGGDIYLGTRVTGSVLLAAGSNSKTHIDTNLSVYSEDIYIRADEDVSLYAEDDLFLTSVDDSRWNVGGDLDINITGALDSSSNSILISATGGSGQIDSIDTFHIYSGDTSGNDGTIDIRTKSSTYSGRIFTRTTAISGNYATTEFGLGDIVSCAYGREFIYSHKTGINGGIYLYAGTSLGTDFSSHECGGARIRHDDTYIQAISGSTYSYINLQDNQLLMAIDGNCTLSIEGNFLFTMPDGSTFQVSHLPTSSGAAGVNGLWVDTGTNTIKINYVAP